VCLVSDGCDGFAVESGRWSVGVYVRCEVCFGWCRWSSKDTGNGVCGECLARVRLWGVSRHFKGVTGLVSRGFSLRSGEYCSGSNGGVSVQ